jgi:hypothetical protein
MHVLGWRAVYVCRVCTILATEGVGRARRLGDPMQLRAIMTAACLHTTWSSILLHWSARERDVSCKLSVAGRPVARSSSVYVGVFAP